MSLYETIGRIGYLFRMLLDLGENAKMANVYHSTEIFNTGSFKEVKHEIFFKVFVHGGFGTDSIRKETLMIHILHALPRGIETHIKETCGYSHGVHYYTSLYQFFGFSTEEIQKRFTLYEAAFIIQRVFDIIEQNEDLLFYFF